MTISTSKRTVNRISFLVIFTMLALGTILKFCSDNYRQKSLKKTRETWAIVTQKPQCGKGCFIKYKYLNNQNQFVFSSDWGGKVGDCHKNRKLGDTIFIRYSISDPEITEMLHCFWNERLKEKLLNK
ncbi:hypothetical protein [Fluviicola taffensis]|uniref:hypothetical protein n=1 Tax=Fluviicola taffensis TaxID=191579 RepID=UPI0031379A2C